MEWTIAISILLLSTWNSVFGMRPEHFALAPDRHSLTNWLNFLQLRNAMEYNPPDHNVHKTAKALLGRFQEEVLVQFKKEQLGSLRRSAQNTGLKPNSSVAVLMQQKSTQEFQKSLQHSSSTLVVIPHVLMDHWQVSLMCLPSLGGVKLLLILLDSSDVVYECRSKSGIMWTSNMQRI